MLLSDRILDRYQPGCTERFAEMTMLWLQHMPFTHDLAEAKGNYQSVIEVIESSFKGLEFLMDPGSLCHIIRLVHAGMTAKSIYAYA